ncbi:hypothetical protein GCM10010168_21440 [Actinoplanes ianthinogenes]|uniref:Uncharacterized protein n=1 Tax=Actinoplanes ianthinogenes TaxID=122358 RepID=A0ABN6CRC9_9ACTN|nr:hypothetical protein [Actinoplanes ianthinogenes]BCJ47785.1 hypothetical protein Aiant_84420 [Actinoplanes ianthinogenes]GGR04144.1 hypothetical protein GCM10010168_21440 [Actinoplanes ianthinogenes]
MSLTGRPLIVLVVLGAVAALAGTVLIWRRGRRPRSLLRALGVLLTEALLLCAVGLAVNRSEEFYPTWADLFRSAGTTATTATARPGDLDGWLRSRDPAGSGQSISFAWRPDGWTGWHLAAAPTVVVPAGYLEHPDWHYSAVLVTGDGWPAAAGGADQTVVVFARTTPATTAGTLAGPLPERLGQDLRVTGRRWALVTPAAGVKLADEAAASAPDRYPAIAVVQGPAKPVGPIRTAKPVGPVRTGKPVGPVRTGKPVGPIRTVLTAGHPAAGTAVVPVGITVGTAGGLASGIAWAAQQTPPPLATATPPATWVPVQKRHHHPHRPGPSTSAGPRPGGSRVPGQPRH